MPALLAIETSCDETAAAVVDEDGTVRSSVVASQTDLHAGFGGVVPELASRAHIELISSVVGCALDEAAVTGVDLEAVAVTSGPGLVGALLVGIAYAKSLALGWGIPVVEVNHLEAHLASVYLADGDVPFPQTALLVSGGHCLLTRATAPGRYELLGETADDSIGEAYDKVARFLGLGYPGGPVLDRLAAGAPDLIPFPRPMLGEGYAFSFSGLKTAVVNHVRANPGVPVADVAASFVAACMDVLCAKLRRALEEFGDPAMAIVGGVAASPILRSRARTLADEFGTHLLIPPQSMATDNAAMIGVAGWHRLSTVGPSDPAFGPQPDLRLRFASWAFASRGRRDVPRRSGTGPRAPRGGPRRTEAPRPTVPSLMPTTPKSKPSPSPSPTTARADSFTIALGPLTTAELAALSNEALLAEFVHSARALASLSRCETQLGAEIARRKAFAPRGRPRSSPDSRAPRALLRFGARLPMSASVSSTWPAPRVT